MVASKTVRICFAIVLFMIIILISVLVALFFTIWKPKPPEIIPHPARLRNVTFAVFPSFSLNAPLNLTITVRNPNPGDCRYDNSTAHVYYRGSEVAELPFQNGDVPARGEREIVAVASLNGDKVVNSPYFFADYGAGSLNFTSVADMPTMVRILKMFNFHLTVEIICDISVLVRQLYDVTCTCSSKLKF